MTWTFVYVCSLVVGLVLAATSGLLRNLAMLGGRHRHLVIPSADHHPPILDAIARRVSVPLVAFGIVGAVMTVLQRFDARETLVASSIAAAVGGAFAVVALRGRCRPIRTAARATVVGDLAPGAYGQVRLEDAEGKTLLLAAQNVDDAPIAAGSEVEVLDCDRSVVAVRRPVST